MIEAKNPQIQETEENTSRAFIILFPDIESVGSPKHLEERELTPFEQEVAKTTKTIINWYKKNGYKIFGVIYSDTSDNNRFSQYFPRESFDHLIPMETTLNDWTHERYNDEIPKIVSSMRLSANAEVYVSGYHLMDCIAQMTARLRDQGFVANVDIKLSEKLPIMLLAHKVRNVLRRTEPEEALWNYRSWQHLKQQVEGEVERRRL